MLFLNLGDLGGTELGGSGLGLSGGLSEAASPKAPARDEGVLLTGLALRLRLSSRVGVGGLLPCTVSSTGPLQKDILDLFARKRVSQQAGGHPGQK